MAKRKGGKRGRKYTSVQALGPALPLWTDAQGNVFRPSLQDGLVAIPNMDIIKFSVYYDIEERLRMPDGRIFYYVRRRLDMPEGGYVYNLFPNNG